MVVETEMILADWKAYNRFLKRSAKNINRRPWEPWLAWGIAILLAGWIAYVVGFTVYHLAEANLEQLEVIWRVHRAPVMFAFLAFALLIIHVFPFVSDWAPHFLRHADSAALSPFDIKVGEDGISARSDNSSANYTWSAFLSGFELPRHFVLMLDRTTAIVLPKRCFGGETEIGTVRDSLEKYLGGLRQV